jgi:hypothetical protein
MSLTYAQIVKYVSDRKCVITNISSAEWWRMFRDGTYDGHLIECEKYGQKYNSDSNINIKDISWTNNSNRFELEIEVKYGKLQVLIIQYSERDYYYPYNRQKLYYFLYELNSINELLVDLIERRLHNDAIEQYNDDEEEKYNQRIIQIKETMIRNLDENSA